MAYLSAFAMVWMAILGWKIGHANDLVGPMETCRHEKDLNQRAAACAFVISQTKDRRALLRAHNTRGLALCDLDRCAEAVADFDEVLRLDSSIAGYFDNRARALRTAGRFEEAIRDSDRAIGMAPTYAFTFFGKALALDDEKRFDDALAVLDQAGKIDPTNSGVWELRGKLLGEAGRFNEAYAAYNRALELQPSRINVFRTRATTEEIEGKIETALSDLKQYPMIGPQSEDVNQQIARLNKILADRNANSKFYASKSAKKVEAAMAPQCRAVKSDIERLDCYDKANSIDQVSQVPNVKTSASEYKSNVFSAKIVNDAKTGMANDKQVPVAQTHDLSNGVAIQDDFYHSFTVEIIDYDNMGTKYSSRKFEGDLGIFSTIEECEKMRSFLSTGKASSLFDTSQRFYKVMTCVRSTATP